ncbi:hypothetical protein L218DRAFT_952690, partial [Marasmius fiardii PR-910]
MLLKMPFPLLLISLPLHLFRHRLHAAIQLLHEFAGCEAFGIQILRLFCHLKELVIEFPRGNVIQKMLELSNGC